MRAAAQSPLPLSFGVSVVAALLLCLYPLPMWLLPARPDWLALLVVYWIRRLPHGFGVGWAWLIGLLMDGLEGGVLGRHAFALAVVAYAGLLLRRRMLLYSLPQQVALVCALCAMHQILLYWVQNLTGHAPPSLVFLMGSLTSAFLWPAFASGAQRERFVDGWRASP